MVVSQRVKKYAANWVERNLGVTATASSVRLASTTVLSPGDRFDFIAMDTLDSRECRGITVSYTLRLHNDP